jgi:predicted RNase H-like nuclease (RuvC/YqgF family)
MLGLSERQIHIRLAKLSTLLDNHIHTGKHNRKLIDDQGFAILNRVVELERDGIAVDLAVEQVKRELDNGDKIGLKSDVNRGITTELLEELRRTIERLERDKEFLQARLEAKEREIERLHDIITNRLPGKVDPQWTEGGAQARSVEYMQQTINAQREEIERLRRELEERRPWWQRLFRRS